jgi:hypothetical protein
MQVNYEIETAAANVAHNARNAQGSEEFRAVAYRNAVNRERFIGVAGKFYNRDVRTPDSDGDARVLKAFAYEAQRGQTQDDIAELTEVYDEDVARFGNHVLTDSCERVVVAAASRSRK